VITTGKMIRNEGISKNSEKNHLSIWFLEPSTQWVQQKNQSTFLDLIIA